MTTVEIDIMMIQFYGGHRRNRYNDEPVRDDHRRNRYNDNSTVNQFMMTTVEIDIYEPVHDDHRR